MSVERQKVCTSIFMCRPQAEWRGDCRQSPQARLQLGGLALCSTWYALPNMRLSLGCLHRSDDLSGQNIKNGRSGATQDSDCKYCTNHGRCGLLNMGCELADDFGLSIHVEEFCADAQIDLVSEDRLLVVKSGVVKTIHLDTHRRFRVIGFSFPGDLIGLEVLAGFNHSGVGYKAAGPLTSVCSTKIHPALAKRVSPYFSQRLSSELATRKRTWNAFQWESLPTVQSTRIFYRLLSPAPDNAGKQTSFASALCLLRAPGRSTFRCA